MIVQIITAIEESVSCDCSPASPPPPSCAVAASRPSPANLLQCGSGTKLLGTALLLSSWKGSYQWVCALLEMGADPNARDPAGRTSLHLAAINGKIDISKKLLECGAKVISNLCCKKVLMRVRNYPLTVIDVMQHGRGLFAGFCSLLP